MSIFSKMAENKAQRREAEKQRLMFMSEKELMVEILLELKELNKQSARIRSGQATWSN